MRAKGFPFDSCGDHVVCSSLGEEKGAGLGATTVIAIPWLPPTSNITQILIKGFLAKSKSLPH